PFVTLFFVCAFGFARHATHPGRAGFNPLQTASNYSGYPPPRDTAGVALWRPQLLSSLWLSELVGDLNFCHRFSSVNLAERICRHYAAFVSRAASSPKAWHFGDKADMPVALRL